MFDFIFIIGQIDSYETIVNSLLAKSDKKIAIIKTADELANLKNKIGSHARIDVWAHGAKGKLNNEHWIQIEMHTSTIRSNNGYSRTSDFFDYLRYLANSKTLNGLQVHLWSCFGGRAINFIGNLPLDATLIIHAPLDTYSFNAVARRNMLTGLTRHCEDPFVEFMHILAGSPEACSIARQMGHALFIYQFS